MSARPEMAGDVTTARLRYAWADQLLQTAEMRPLNSHAVHLDWQCKVAPVDCGVPRRLAEAISTALVRIGPVLFRWLGTAAWPSDQGTIIQSRSSLAQAVIGRVTGQRPSDLVLTRHASVAMALFDHGWELQAQAALVLDEGHGMGERLQTELATRHRWADFTLEPPARVFLAPSVDGDGILFATASQTDLQRLTAGLAYALAEAAIAITPASPAPRSASG